jgi:hypothetical protein
MRSPGYSLFINRSGGHYWRTKGFWCDMQALKPDQTLLSFSQPGVMAKYIGKIGWGLFAEVDFAPGDCICRLSLDRFTEYEIIPWEYSFGAYFDRSFTVAPGYAWCAAPTHPFWYINHSCAANSGFVNWGQTVHGQMPVVAYQRIPPGEQITMDYALFTASYDGDPTGGPWRMNSCLCHSDQCRGVITGFHALPLDLQLEAILPQSELKGRVLAHMVMEIPGLTRILRQLSPGLYMSYLEALNEQLVLSKALCRAITQKPQPVHAYPFQAAGTPAAWANSGL